MFEFFFNRNNGLKVTPLGGVELVGQNCFLYETDRFVLVVDCGIKPQTQEEIGVSNSDWRLANPPDLQLLDAALSGGKKPLGIITHGHLDHLGAVAELSRRRIPVYLSAWTKKFLERNAADLRVPVGAQFNIIKNDNNRLTHGDFEIRFIPLRHSIPGTVGLVISAKGKTVVHLTDFKFNSIDNGASQFEAALRAVKQEAGHIHGLLLDVLNSDLTGFTPPESQIIGEIGKIIQEAKGRLFISFFSTNLFRMQRIIEAAQAAGKSVQLLGGMRRSYEMIAPYLSKQLPADGPGEVVLLGGSQGEANSALSRVAGGTHRLVRARRGDQLVVSARSIPGNEAAIRPVLMALHDRGVVITLHHGEGTRLALPFDVEEGNVHVSGHGSRGDIQRAIEILQPDVIVPIHATPDKLEFFELMAKAWSVRDRVKFLKTGQTLRV